VILSKSIMSCSLEALTGAAGFTSASAVVGTETVGSDIVAEPSLDPVGASLEGASCVLECLHR